VPRHPPLVPLAGEVLWCHKDFANLALPKRVAIGVLLQMVLQTVVRRLASPAIKDRLHPAEHGWSEGRTSTA